MNDEWESIKRESRSAFKEAWSLFIRLPLPGSARRESGNAHAVVAMLPVIGLLIGIVLWLLAILVANLVQSRLVAAVLCGIIVPGFYWWLTRTRTIHGMIETVTAWQCSTSESSEVTRVYGPLVALHGTMVLTGLGVALLVAFYGTPWLILLPTLATAAFAEELQRDMGEGYTSPTAYIHWIIAALVTVLIAGLMKLLIPGLLVLVLAWLLSPVLRRWFATRSSAAEQFRMWAAIGVVEVLTVWIGVVAL